MEPEKKRSMEPFGVALSGAAAGVALPKLLLVIEKLTGKPNIDTTYLKEELPFIEASIQRYRHIDKYKEWISQLSLLAYDIEDIIDRFHANKLSPKDYAAEIVKVKDRSTATGERIKKYIVSLEGTARAAQEQGATVVSTELERLGRRNLKCLLYLRLFPPNHPVRTKPLIRRWLAEGLVDGEQLAVKNFRSFIDSSYISSIQISINGNVKRCQPTHETLQLISQMPMSENFILVCDGTAELPAEGARRLTVHPSANGQLILPEDLSRLRTLAVFPAAASAAPGGAPAPLASYKDVLDFAKYDVLRVLDLKECVHLSEEHLNDIIIKHPQVLMKYLSIRLGSTWITRSIVRLNQLETLDLSGSEIVTVFKEILMLPNLKHLLGQFQLSMRDTFCVPVLGLFESKLEKFLSDKSVLETLAGFVTGKRYGFPQLMSLIRGLRKVKIWCKPNASQRNLAVLSCAITKFIRDGVDERPGRSLSIDFEKCSGQFLNTIPSDVGDKGGLTSLNLRGKLSQFPRFAENLRAIEELCLWSTGLSWENIQEGLKKLGILKYLKLVEDKLGRIQIEHQQFRSIERICIVFKTPVDIAIQADALPNLVSLHILCKDLHATPDIKISHMKKLKEVALHPDVKDEIKDEWQKAVHDHPYKPVPVLLLTKDPDR